MALLDEIEETKAERINLLSREAINAIRQIAVEAIAAVRVHANEIGWAEVKSNLPRDTYDE